MNLYEVFILECEVVPFEDEFSGWIMSSVGGSKISLEFIAAQQASMPLL